MRIGFISTRLACTDGISLEVAKSKPLIIQPTRVVQRKGIELAIELVSRLKLSKKRLFVSHSTKGEGSNYWHWVEREAHMMGVPLELIEHMINDQREQINGKKTYSLVNAYHSADLITYPSIYEGFGNALLEAIYYKCPVVVNCYPIYNSDIRPLGFQFIELDGFVDGRAVDHVIQVILRSQDVDEMVASKNFSLEMLETKLSQVLASF